MACSERFFRHSGPSPMETLVGSESGRPHLRHVDSGRLRDCATLRFLRISPFNSMRRFASAGRHSSTPSRGLSSASSVMVPTSELISEAASSTVASRKTPSFGVVQGSALSGTSGSRQSCSVCHCWSGVTDGCVGSHALSQNGRFASRTLSTRRWSWLWPGSRSSTASTSSL